MDKRIALVTGAAKRTGRTIAEYLSERGYASVIHYNGSEQDAAEAVAAIEAAGGEASALQADLNSASGIDALIDTVYGRYGRLDLLVNNASVFRQEHFPDFSVDDLDEAWRVNCRAPILLTRAFYRRAKAAEATGAVVNIVDQKVKQNFHRDHFSYTVAKTALGNLTAMLAISAAPVLRVNGVFPGLMLRSDDQTDDDFAFASRVSNPLGRVAGPLDIAAAVLLLASPAYNGTDFVVDGGQNLVRVPQDVLYLHRAPAGNAQQD
jgi:NAD(P)-dependent dehydrogenase (short-subunit alcohol dehydrogenase family)